MTATQQLKRNIRQQFDSLSYWQHREQAQLIATAKSYGFKDLVNEMNNDILTENI